VVLDFDLSECPNIWCIWSQRLFVVFKNPDDANHYPGDTIENDVLVKPRPLPGTLSGTRLKTEPLEAGGSRTES